MSETCPLCRQPVSTNFGNRQDSFVYPIECRRCGKFEVTTGVWYAGKGMNAFPGDRDLLSALTRTAPVRQVPPVLVNEDLFKALMNGQIRERTFTEKRDALLDWIAYESRKTWRPYGALVDYNPSLDYPVAFCHSVDDGKWDEWNFIFQPLVRDGLISEMGNGKVRLTDKGWELIEARPRAAGDQGFIAMWFKDTDLLYKAIAAGIDQAGYRPSRIDREEFIGGVTDEIIAKIRESRFVVADLWGNRGGVYYEAGVAFGLNLPVFMLCKQDQVRPESENRVHFDVQHMNLLTWEVGKLEELTKRLTDRIVAVLGRGPRLPSGS
jgi:hypothetical protein